MDEMQKKNQSFSQVLNKPDYKGKRAQMLQDAGLDALAETDQTSLIKELLDAQEDTGLISH